MRNYQPGPSTTQPEELTHKPSFRTTHPAPPTPPHPSKPTIQIKGMHTTGAPRPPPARKQQKIHPIPSHVELSPPVAKYPLHADETQISSSLTSSKTLERAIFPPGLKIRPTAAAFH